MMNKLAFKIILISGIAISMGLSGCMATQYIEGKSYKELEQVVELSDTFLAIGKPKTAIPKHETALIIVGEKYNYLVEGGSKSNQQEISDIFNYLDLNYIRIEHMGKIVRHGKTYSSPITLRYTKPKHLVTAKEFEISQKLNSLNCVDNHPNYVGSYSCPFHVGVDITPMVKPEQQILQHRFSSPIKVDFYSPRGKNKPTILLKPLAMVVDVVTFPIQAVKVISTLDETWK